jgi:zinc-ribbon domain
MSNHCTSCGAALRPNVKFCTACGAAVVADAEGGAGFEAYSGATPQDVDADAAASPTSKKLWIIGGSILALLVAYAIFIAFFAPKKSESLDAANAAGNAVSAVAANPAITGQAADMYVVADANVRDQPTAQGSNIVTKLTRGTKINGTLQIGADGTSAWMKLTDGTGYIGAVNLNTNVPPTLTKTFADMKWNVEEGTDLLAFPAAGSAVVAHLNKGDQTTLAGVTDNGYAEAKRSKGGVAYFFVTAGNDRTGQLAVAAVSAAGATGGGRAPLTLEKLNDDPASGGGCFATLVSNTNQTIGIAPLGVGDEIWTLKLNGLEIGFKFAPGSSVSRETTKPSAYTLNMHDFVKFGPQPEEGINEKGYFDVSDDGNVTSFLVYRNCAA